MSSKIGTNRFGFFASAIKSVALRNFPTNNPALAELDDFTEAHLRKLLSESSPEEHLKIIDSFRKAKAPTTENYLKQFIKDFEHDSAFFATVQLYREKLALYQQTKVSAAQAAFNASKQISEGSNDNAQEIEWQQLLETLKRCVNNCSTRLMLSWHPHYLENYYLGKLHIQWHRYETQYDSVVLDNFANTLADEIAEDRRKTVREKDLEQQKLLMDQRMNYSPTRLTNQKIRLENQKEINFKEIEAMTQLLVEYAEEIIAFAQQPKNQIVKQVFDKAVLEIQRQELAIASRSISFFNRIGGHRQKHHALATLNKIDNMEKMNLYRDIFIAESAAIETKLQNSLEN